MKSIIKAAHYYWNGFKSFVSKKVNKIIIILAVIFTLGACVFYYVSQSVYEKAVVEQMLHREQVVSRAGSSSVESFLNLLGNQIANYSTRGSIVNPGTGTQKDLDLFMKIWEEEPIGGIILTDNKGVVMSNSNKSGTRVIGSDVSDRDYFLSLISSAQEGEFIIGTPVVSRMGDSKGKYIVVIASPVIKDGQFNGILAVSIILSDLANKYLDPLKVSPQTRIYLIDSNGVILHSPFSNLVGVNYFEYLNGNKLKDSDKIINSLDKILRTEGESKLDIFLPAEPNFQLKQFLIAVSTVDISKFSNSMNWKLAIASPVDDAFLFLYPYSSFSIAYLIFGIFIVLAFSALIILIVKIEMTKAYKEGFNNAQEKK